MSVESLLIPTSAACLSAIVFVSYHPKCSFLRRKFSIALWMISTILIMVATGLLVRHLLNSDFQYSYVAGHTSKGLAPIFKISSLWSGQEGSFLLWSLVMCLMGFNVFGLDESYKEKVIALYAIISFIICLMCSFANPFTLLATPPLDGAGLDSALQNPWMVVHPPLVFIGYSAMALLAGLSAIPSEKFDYKRIYYRWLLFSWTFLGAGIFTGSIWAYQALGWGGYWAWDPIENTALVPWLVMCGYIHDRSKINRLRCLLPFILACVGTFLTRSGILKGQSTHSYTDNNLMVSILILLLISTAGIYLLIEKKIQGHL